jgi:hypothetical protein
MGDAMPLQGAAPAQLAQAEPGALLPLPTDPAAGAGSTGDPLASVGLALLAYALVQLLARVVDRLPIGHGAAGGKHGADDRERLERVHELARTDHERIERMEKLLREVHEQTRWLNEQRLLGRDGTGPFHCQAPALREDLATNRRLVGQALDALREIQADTANLLRKLRALWGRVGRRRDDQG